MQKNRRTLASICCNSLAQLLSMQTGMVFLDEGVIGHFATRRNPCQLLEFTFSFTLPLLFGI